MSRKRLIFNENGHVDTPTFVLSTVGGKLLGQIPFIDESTIEVLDNFNDTSEISFDVYKTLNGELNPMWDQIKNFKLIWYREHNQCYVIQVDINDESGLCKHVTGQSAGEVELGQIMLHDIEINTEDDIDRDDYEVAVLYNQTDSERSILDRLLDKAPHYTIKNVDYTIADIQRSFSFDGDSIKDAFDKIAEEIGCVFVYDVYFEDGELKREINVYDLEYYCMNTGCGERFEYGSVCPKCGGANIRSPFGDDTGIIIDKDSLASDVSLETDVDSVKNCFMLEAGDDLMTAAVRMCMPSADGYLWSFNSDTMDDMSDGLREKIESYNEEYNKYNKTYVYDTSDSTYGALVTKYYDEDDADVTYSATATGFPGVVDAYYNAITLYYYVKTSMMPTIELAEATAETSLANVKANLKSVAVSNFSDSTSSATVESVVKNMAKMYYIQSQYDISVSTSSWSTSSTVWTGTITLTSRIDDDDGNPVDSATASFSLTVGGDYETYIRQQLEKQISNAEANDPGVVTLFNKDLAAFQVALKKYSYDCLDEYWQICQTCINLLIEAGWGNNSTVNETAYEYYTGLRNKLVSIESERDIRNAEVKAIENYESKMLDIIEDVHDKLNLKDWIGEYYNEFAAYRREDIYSNDNYISDGLSDADLIDNAKLFIKAAEREIYKSSNLQHTISATVYNLMMMPEFESLLEKFEVGNWIRVIIDDVAYKLRLLSYTINFGSIQNIDVEFSDMSMAGAGVADLSSIIAQASSMATSYGAVTRQAEKANAASTSFRAMLAQGLDLTNTKLVSSADHQEMVVDSHGITMKKYDPVADDYSDKQMKITNTTIAYTENDWETVKTAFGKYYDADGNEQYGVIGDSLVGRIIAGENLTIQSDKTDGSGNAVFKVDSDGVQLRDTSMYVTCSSGNAEIVISPENGFVIGSTDVVKSDGTIDTDKAKFWVDADGNVQIKLSSDSDVGNAMVSTEQQYCKGESNTAAPDDVDGWSSTIPAEEDGYYIWTRTKITRVSGDISYTTAELVGKDSGVESVTPYYISVESKNTTPSTANANGWTSTPIVQSDGRYIWEANKVTYNDGTVVWSTPVCITDSVAREQYNELSLTVDGIKGSYVSQSTLSSLQDQVDTINKALDFDFSSEGITAVITEQIQSTAASSVTAVEENGKKYVFDTDGLTISNSSGSGMSTLIDETGMVVSYSGSNVLTSTADGVTAINLHAQKFLKIGSGSGRSRFEDYGTKYTACYWIG